MICELQFDMISIIEIRFNMELTLRNASSTSSPSLRAMRQRIMHLGPLGLYIGWMRCWLTWLYISLRNTLSIVGESSDFVAAHFRATCITMNFVSTQILLVEDVVA